MKTIYLLGVAACLLCYGCTDDAADVKPAYGALIPAPGGEDGELDARNTADWFTLRPWTVDTLHIKVIENEAMVSDTAFVPYGTFRFKTIARQGSGSRHGLGVQQVLHTHPTWNAQVVTDTLLCYIGDYDRGIASPNLMTVWKDGDEAGKLVFTRILNQKQMCKYESRVAVAGENGSSKTLVRSFTISR